MRQTRTLLILDLFRQPNSFLASEAADIARRLEADGAHVELVSAVLEDAASREQLARTIRDMRPAIAILLRAWDAELIELVRGALPSATAVVRFARRGVEGALDAHFDQVVDDPEALVAWARGESIEGGARFVPVKARALLQ
ncbi:MAG: hypothetical protein GXP55_25930, partial [Deltaproteobacteria bacterium]|nr:hypothetical protein [Deltaproteobacteria bacterium]